MELLMKLLPFGRKSEEQMGQRLEQALHSLRARGIVETFKPVAPAVFRLQWDRGNYGLELAAQRARRGWEMTVTPICNPAGPFAGDKLGGEIMSLPEWLACGKTGRLERLDRTGHVDLVDYIRELEATHPAAEWMSALVKRLAEGDRPSEEDLQGLVLLGARRFLKTIPGSDRLHEAIEPALVTLIAMTSSRQPQVEESELDVFAGEDYGRALVEFLQETHPLEARRAVQRYIAAR